MCADNRLQFTVPMDGMVLTAVGTMLLGLASALERKAEPVRGKTPWEGIIAPLKDDGLAGERIEYGQPCGCDADTVVYDSQATQPQVDAAAIFGAPAPPLYPTDFPDGTNVIIHPGGGAVEPLQPGQRVLVELDTNGLPWDRRIHASTKTKCADGSWKKARGVDPAIVATVEAELKAAMSAPGPIVSPEVTAAQIVTPPPPPASAVAPPPPPSASPLVEQVVTLTAPPAGPLTFPEFLTKVTAMCTAGQTTHEAVAAACQKHGLAGIPLLASRPDLIPVVAAELGVV